MGLLLLRKTRLGERLLLKVAKRVNRFDLKEFFHLNRIEFTSYVTWYFISVLGWLFTYCLLFFCFRMATVENVELLDVVAKSPVMTLGRLFPFTLNGIGSDELLITYLFKQYSTNLILVGSILYRMILIVFPALGGFVFLIKK